MTYNAIYSFEWRAIHEIERLGKMQTFILQAMNSIFVAVEQDSSLSMNVLHS